MCIKLKTGNIGTRNQEEQLTNTFLRMVYIGIHCGHPKGILKRQWGILHMDPNIAKIVGPHPCMTTKRTRNLKDSLVRIKF